jgi:cytochrome c553
MKRFFKWTGLGLLVILLLVAAVAGSFRWQLGRELGTEYDITPAPLEIPEPDSAIIARGERIAAMRHCDGCHLPDFSGHVMFENPVMGQMVSANLTSGEGGIGASYTDEDWVRAIRHGVNPDGRPLMVMPSEEYGDYLAAACRGCHGKDLGGQESFGQPVPDLRVLRDWSVEDLRRAVQERVSTDGRTYLEMMPRWTVFSDEDVEAIWMYLQSLEPIAREES